MTTGSVLAQFTITLSQAVSEQVAVEWHTADGTALAGVDYAAAKGTVLFAPGQTAKTVDILVHGRAVGSEDRSFFVEMLPPTNAILGASIGECIIHVDTIGSTPVTQIIVPTGPQGLQGDSAYQAWLDLGNTGTEQDFINSLKPSAEEIAEEVAPLLDVSNSPLTAEGTETLSKPDTMTGKRLARRVAYVGAAKVATVVLADGDNLIAHAALSGDAVDFNSISLYPRILRGTVVISPEWSVEPGDKILIKSAVVGDVLHVCQYDVISERAVRNVAERLVAPVGSQAFEALRRSYAEAGYNVVGTFQEGFTLVNANDVGIDLATGKGYTGPAGTVAAGTNPASGGFVDRSALLPRVITTISGVATGMFSAGSRLELSDRNGALFTVVSGGVADGLGIIAAGSGKTAQYEWSQPTAGDPRHFGGKPNDDTFDSTAAVKYAAENSRLYFDGVYTISDEVVIKTGSVIRSIGKSGVKVKIGSSMTGKAAIRASYLPIGATPDMGKISNHVRGISQVGQLYINANNTADYGFYGRGIAAESELDFIVAENAKICAIAYLTSWFSSIKTGFFGLNSGVNIAIGSPLSGETGDIFVNGYNFPLLASFNTKVPTGTVYNQDGTVAEQKAAAGIILGVGFANRVGTLVSQAAQGANLVFSKMIGFSFGSIYVENGSRYTPSRRTGILVASDNADASTAPVDYVHLEANQQIMSRTANLLLDINTLYRYDNVKSFDSASAPLSMRVKNPSFYVRNAYGNVPPAALIYDRAEQEVYATGPADSATAAASRLSIKWLYRSGSHMLRVKLSAVATAPVTILLSTNTTNETFNVTDSLEIGLSGARTEGSWYTIGIASPTSDAGIKATVSIYRQVTPWAGI